ncbi:MAG: twin-arginine translocation signal domain-containing protein, partial [Planctomycetota bacterium]
MDHHISRRELIRLLGASGLAAGAGSLLPSGEAWSDPAGRKDAPSGVKVEGPPAPPAVLVDGKVIQPQRELAVLDSTDVLVVGGGPAGVVAALAAKR